MKKLILLFLLLPLLAIGQTSFSRADIQAASGNRHETLLTNTDAMDTSADLQGFAQSGLGMFEISHNFDNDKKPIYVYAAKSQQGKEKRPQIKITFNIVDSKKYQFGMAKDVTITGDWEYAVKFFTTFWSRKISLGDVKVGELASTRFLTDVATISYNQDGTGTIKVVTAKDRT